MYRLYKGEYKEMGKLITYNKDILEWGVFPQYDILYTDPPWGQSMVKYFETIRIRDTGVYIRHSVVDILTHLARLADKGKPLFIEYSVLEHQQVVRIMGENGHKLNHVTQMIQTNHKPYVLLSFNTSVEIEPNLIGNKSICEVLKKTKPSVVFDPFAGIGFTAREVLKLGATYIGSEFNKDRYERLKAI